MTQRAVIEEMIGQCNLAVDEELFHRLRARAGKRRLLWSTVPDLREAFATLTRPKAAAEPATEENETGNGSRGISLREITKQVLRDTSTSNRQN